MSLKANNNEKLINIKTYIVSTAKETSKKPLGLGSITAISLMLHLLLALLLVEMLPLGQHLE